MYECLAYLSELSTVTNYTKRKDGEGGLTRRANSSNFCKKYLWSCFFLSSSIDNIFASFTIDPWMKMKYNLNAMNVNNNDSGLMVSHVRYLLN